jgi:predicted RNA-binding protein YlqC (UPF0109 family)
MDLQTKKKLNSRQSLKLSENLHIQSIEKLLEDSICYVIKPATIRRFVALIIDGWSQAGGRVISQRGRSFKEINTLVTRNSQWNLQNDDFLYLLTIMQNVVGERIS